MIMVVRESIENKPQIMAPRVTPLEGVSCVHLRLIKLQNNLYSNFSAPICGLNFNILSEKLSCECKGVIRI